MIETTNREAYANNVSQTEQNIFVSFEHQILEFWKTKNIYQKTQKQNAEKPPYWYYDGPPFATGLPHHGHLLASTIKDVIPRYFEMKGHFVPRYFEFKPFIIKTS